MTRKLLFSTLLAWCLFAVTGMAQMNQAWKWVHPSPQGNRLNYIKLWSTTEWYAIGFSGTFMKTTNAGTDWNFSHVIGRQIGTSLQKSVLYDAHFFDMNTGLAVGGQGTIARTTDGGASWADVSPMVATSTVTFYQLYFLNNSVGYVCGTSGNLYKTTDAGLTWAQVTTGVTTSLFDIYTANDTLIVMATTAGNVRRSTDGGATWANVNTGVTVSLNKIDFATPQTGFVVAGSGNVRLTTDGGATWAAANAGLPTTSTFWDIDFRPSSEGFILFVTGDPFNVYKSNNLGASWDTLGFLHPAQPWTSTMYAADLSLTGDSLVVVGAFGLMQGRAGAGGRQAFTTLSTVGAKYDVWASSTGQNIIAVGAPSSATSARDQMVRSTDGGATWALVPFSANSTATLWSIDMVDDQVGYVSGTNSAIYKTTNGGASWDSLVTTIPAGGTLRKIDFVDANTGWVFAGAPSTFTNFIFKTTDGGATWTPQSHGISAASNGQVYGAHMLNANDGYLITWQPRPYRTTDGGATWVQQTTVDAFGGFLYDIKMADTANGYMVGSSGRAYKTTNGGLLWDTLTVPTRSYAFQSLEMPQPNVLMIVGATGVSMYSVDGGANWTMENTQASSITLNGSAVWVNPQGGVTYWAVGTSATIMKNNSFPVPVELVSFGASVIDGKVHLNWRTTTELNNSGFEVERRTGAGEWTKIGFVTGSGTTVAQKDYSFIDQSAASGKYSYRLRQVDYDGTASYSGVVEVDLSSPISFTLDQNYPNPFNPVTTIKYQVAEPSLVTLKVYDVIGNEVVVLVNKEQETGSYSINFNASKYASGMYIYKLTAGKFEKTLKMMLLK